MTSFRDDAPRALHAALWIVLIAGASLCFSRAFACATPFVALATLAGTQVRRPAAFAAVGLAFAGNQAIGFLLLHYPHAAETYAWGAAIGVAALAATYVTTFMAARVPAAGPARLALAFAAAFATYEGVLFGTSLILGSGAAAFAPAVVGRILAINVLAFAALLAGHRLASAAGLAVPRAATA